MIVLAPYFPGRPGVQANRFCWFASAGASVQRVAYFSYLIKGKGRRYKPAIGLPEHQCC